MAVQLASLTWDDWINHYRLIETTGNVTSAEAGAAFWWQLKEPVNTA